MKVTEQVAAFAEPIVKEHGCALWDVEYVREGSEYFLRLYIDKDGGVDINDCEAISRAVDPILDEKDPIPDSYSFEAPFRFCAVYGQPHHRQALPPQKRHEGDPLRPARLRGRQADRGSGEGNRNV